MLTSARKLNLSKLNLWIDIVLFVAFIVDYNTHFTGIAIHEWLGIALIALFVYHLLLHWSWIVTMVSRVTQILPTIDRIKSVVDLLLYVAMVIVIASGIWISEVAMGQLGITIQPSGFWRQLHHLSAEMTIWLTGLHLALSWSWIVTNFNRYIWQPFRRIGRLSTSDGTSAEVAS